MTATSELLQKLIALDIHDARLPILTIHTLILGVVMTCYSICT